MKDPTARVWTVYRYFDADDRLLYVGMTGQGHLRAHGHGRGESAWWPLVVRGEFEHFATMEEAFERELALIRTLTPPYNRADNPAWTPATTLQRVTEPKRDQVERYIAGLTPDQRGALTASRVAADLAEEGYEVSERYVADILGGRSAGRRNGHRKP